MSGTGWLENIFRPLVVGAMIGAIVLSLGEMLRLLLPGLDLTGLVGLSALVTVEAYYSQRYVATRRWDVGPHLRYRAAEVFLIFLVVRVGLLVGRGERDLLGQLRQFDEDTIAALAVVLLAWFTGGRIAADIARIGEPPEQVPGYQPPLAALTSRFFMGGALLLLFTGLSRIEIVQLINLARPSVPGLVLNVLVYFVLGIVLLGQARYEALTRRWAEQEVRVPATLAPGWVRSSLVLAGVAALVAFLLPTEYTFGLLDTLAVLVGSIAGLFWFLVLALVGLVVFLLSLIGLHPAPAGAPRTNPPPAIPPPPPDAAPGTNWLDFAQSALFWIAIAAVVVYMVRGYLGQHPQVRDALRRLRPWAGLGHRLAGWWARLRGAGRAVRSDLRRRLAQARAPRTAAPPPAGFARATGVTPREQIYRYYTAVLRRAASTGLPRRPAQTPDEYRSTLAPALPQATPDLAGLTGAFVEARYSPHPIPAAQAEAAYRAGQQVEAALVARAAAPPPPESGPGGSPQEATRAPD